MVYVIIRAIIVLGVRQYRIHFFKLQRFPFRRRAISGPHFRRCDLFCTKVRLLKIDGSINNIPSPFAQLRVRRDDDGAHARDGIRTIAPSTTISFVHCVRGISGSFRRDGCKLDRQRHSSMQCRQIQKLKLYPVLPEINDTARSLFAIFASIWPLLPKIHWLCGYVDRKKKNSICHYRGAGWRYRSGVRAFASLRGAAQSGHGPLRRR